MHADLHETYTNKNLFVDETHVILCDLTVNNQPAGPIIIRKIPIDVERSRLYILFDALHIIRISPERSSVSYARSPDSEIW